MCTVLTVRTLALAHGVSVSDVACRDEPRHGKEEEAQSHALVFVRRGSFRRTSRAGRFVIDPTRFYTLAPGDEHRYDHPHGQDDECTYVTLAAEVVHEVAEADRLPAGPFLGTPAVHLAQRALVATARRNDPDALLESSFALLTAVVPELHRRAPTKTGATARRRAALVEDARGLLADEPSLSLTALAGLLGVSPHHLSRIFATETGLTVSRYRMRLRARSGAERIADGERDLATLAADLGLADQSHLNRLLRTELGRTPTELRRRPFR
jgi:AraC-like DNA-binding protein